jgi:hypothetical protein
MPLTAEERRNSRAAALNSMLRAESLCVDEDLMWRHVNRLDPQAYLIVESWRPRRAWQSLIRLAESLDV